MIDLYIAEPTREGNEIVGILFEGNCFKKGDRVVLKSKEKVLKEYGNFNSGSKIQLKESLKTRIAANWGYAPEMIEWAEKKVVFIIKKIDGGYVVLEGIEETIPKVTNFTYTVAMIQHEKEQPKRSEPKDFWEALEVL